MELFNRLPGIAPEIDRYGFEMGFMHATPSGQTSLEAALLRILDLCGEAALTGPRWHANLIARPAHPVGKRPAIPGADAARAADETRRFRSAAVREGTATNGPGQ